MITFKTIIKVRYNEVDRMGYLHHSVYPVYLEIARCSMLKDLGFSYRQFEDEGLIMPVYSIAIQYKHPAFYDDELMVLTHFNSLESFKLILNYETFNQNMKTICTACSENVFVNSLSKKPVKAPEKIIKAFENYSK